MGAFSLRKDISGRFTSSCCFERRAQLSTHHIFFPLELKDQRAIIAKFRPKCKRRLSLSQVILYPPFCRFERMNPAKTKRWFALAVDHAPVGVVVPPRGVSRPFHIRQEYKAEPFLSLPIFMLVCGFHPARFFNRWRFVPWHRAKIGNTQSCRSFQQRGKQPLASYPPDVVGGSPQLCFGEQPMQFHGKPQGVVRKHIVHGGFDRVAKLRSCRMHCRGLYGFDTFSADR